MARAGRGFDYDAIVVGAGPAGEALVERLHAQDLRTALIERELIGGECAYWACMPSKTLLRAAQLLGEAERAAGLERPSPRWRELSEYRDYMIRGLDDSAQEKAYAERGIDVLRGEARIAAPGEVEVAGEVLRAPRIVIATGSEPIIPEISGLSQAGYWTTREATTITELPASVIVLGGGPVGVELAQFLGRFGVEVTIVEPASRLLSREEPFMGELIARTLGEEGIDVRTGEEVSSVAVEGGSRVATLSGGGSVSASELLLAVGRRPRVSCVAAALPGVETDGDGLRVDERCRLTDGVWAIGDVTGRMPFTHVAKYQARVVARDIAGERVAANYDAIPRVVFCDPELAAVGLTVEQAREREMVVTVARVELPEAIARPSTYERCPRGELRLIADRARGVLVGAAAAAPLAGEWIHQAVLAIRAQVPLDVLRDTVAQFPTFSEAYVNAVEQLAR